MKINILITQRHQRDKHGVWVDTLENGYVEFIESFGVNVIPMPNVTRRIGEYIRTFGISRIVLTGGGDVDPALYGGKAGPDMAVSEKRDKLEADLLKIAIESNIPVFGVCRGMQFIHIYFKGGLLPDLDGVDTGKIHAPGKRHKVEILEKELRYAVDGAKEYEVNSFHNQGFVETVPGELKCFAREPETGVIEGIYHKKYPIAGIMWHPEREPEPTLLDKVLFSSFLEGTLYWRKNK